jgi:outer membrane lipoprotein-sorting protein
LTPSAARGTNKLMSSIVSRAALVFFLVAPSAHAQTSAQIVAKVDARYANVRTYNHAFSQTLRLAAYNQTKVQQGTMSLARPSSMSFVYANGDRFTVSGTTVTAVTSGQTITQNISQTSFPALGFLTGQTTLAASFTFTQAPIPFQGGFTLVGTPIQPMGQYTKALFYVDSQTSDVRRITLIDAQRNTNTFDL